MPRMHTNDERGAVAVEFALLLPLLLSLVFGIIQFGLALNEKLTLTHAAREGARAAVVGADPVAAVKDAATGLGLQSGDVTINTACSDKTSGEEASVTANGSFELSIPFATFGTLDLSSTAVMRCP
jgi:Flp pilus assembly protein TadG